MKHFTLFCLATALAASVQGQVIFTSGFEDWAAGLPTDWYGVRSNLPQSGVAQVNTDVHGGTSAVRLTKASTGHQRFTTQVQTVVANQEYEVRFWVRGEGQIRIGLYDGRPTGSGYAPYNPTGFVSITGNTWQEVVLNITAVMNATDAEFILSVQSTVEPEHLVVDDVTITAMAVNPPTPATIVEIQETTAPDGASPLAGTLVITTGVVSGLVANGFFIQDGSGPWTGLFIFGTLTGLAIGDAVTVTGSVTEFNGQSQLASVSNITVNSAGNALTPTVITTAQGNTEPYESVFVKANAAECISQGSFGQYTVNDGSGPVLVDDVIYAHPFVVGETYNITGVLQFSFSEWRILPRFASDVELVTGINDLVHAAIMLSPNPASESIRLESPMAGSGRFDYTISDATGRLVRSGNWSGSSLLVGDLPNGAYVLRLGTNTLLGQARFVVQH
ncbi:MAG: carbohydrate binding domain-containing protein [Flavobacteriales bacterium]|nr:carbohydrate binding domain-containing protein [Flavobacteriales bacterium]